jgi:hypothetical protein
MYADTNATIKGVARQLRGDGLAAQNGRPFTESMVSRLLRCEALAGNFVWGGERYAAGPSKKRQPATRADNVIEPVVPADLWARVQAKLWACRRLRRDKEQLIQVLRERLAENPELNALDLEALVCIRRRPIPTHLDRCRGHWSWPAVTRGQFARCTSEESWSAERSVTE